MDTPYLDRVIALAQVRGYERQVHGRLEEVRSYRTLSGEHAWQHALRQSPAMSAADRAAVDFYQNPPAHPGPNQMLREGWHPEDEPGAEDAASVLGLDRLFARAAPTAAPIVVYRGAPVRTHDLGHVSTTTEPGIAQDFARSASESGAELQRIEVPAGSRVLAVPEKPGYGPSREVLLPRGSRFRVKGRQGSTVRMELVS